MVIRQLGISNFRNLAHSEAVELPGEGLLVAAAPNAYGKTNFLESVGVLLRGKSWRARLDECVQWGADSFVVWGDVEREAADDGRVAVRYHEPSRTVRIEEAGVPASMVSFYAGYPMVLFLPDDTSLLARGPAGRRNLLNQILVAHPNYLSALVQYQRTLRQRNEALKKAQEFDEVVSWTGLLAEHAAVLWRHRERLVEFVAARLEALYEKLTGEARSFEVRLATGAPEVEEYGALLTQSFDQEQRYGYTLYGPHRDDLVITTDDRPVTASLSQGQTRSLVIALKILAYHYTKQVTKETPLLLLDDVLSELDEDRQRTLLEELPRSQIILTCTAVPTSLRRRDDVFLLDLRSIVQERQEEPDGLSDEVGEEELDVAVAEEAEEVAEEVRVP